MPIKIYKPTTPAQRFKTQLTFEEITKTKPQKSLIIHINRSFGRVGGKATVRSRGGGAKRNLRIIDFKRDKKDVGARVASIEYDPNRSANVALLHYEDGDKRYILAPIGLKVNDTIMAAEKTEIKLGHAMPLGAMPIGTLVHNVELTAGRGGQIAKSAGSAATIAAKEGDWVHLKMPSREIRKVHKSCFATIGQVGNIDWKNISIGKAGRNRYFGKRPKVRGVAQDPASHPHGGGEGRSGVGMNPKTPTGKPAFRKTRNRNKPSTRFILKRRK